MPNADNSPDLSSPDAAAEKPFVILLHRSDRLPSGYFRPEATVTISHTLRTSGLLLALPPEEVKSLLLMLTFVTPNGWCQPAVQQLAGAMRVSEAKARARMKRLQDFRWQDRALVNEIKRDSGMDSFALSPAVVGRQDAPEPAEATPSLPPSSRDVIIARSRALYARPRAEVERMIAEQMGWKEVGDSPEARLRRRLMGVAGLLREQIDLLIAQYPQERIERQLAWLPHRRAKSPARFLMAAIENDYDPPPVIRLQQAQAQTDGQPANASGGTGQSEMPEPGTAELEATQSEIGLPEGPEPAAAHDEEGV